MVIYIMKRERERKGTVLYKEEKRGQGFIENINYTSKGYGVCVCVCVIF